jgi:transcription elongation factor Elf1
VQNSNPPAPAQKLATPPLELTFTCAICGEPSHDICVWCTLDACPNHLCEKCHRCTDCCDCPQQHEHDTL